MNTDNHKNVAELVAVRACIAALAREVLLRIGSDSFVQAEAQALQFVSSAAEIDGEFGQRVAERAQIVVADIFRMADA